MDDKDRLIEELKKENEELKKKLKKKSKREQESSSSAWDFHYSGHGDYEEERRCFYGDFG